MDLPKVKGLSESQQARLDAELTARKLTTLAAMRSRPNEVLAAYQAMLAVDVQAVLSAYGDREAQLKQATLTEASFKAASIQPDKAPKVTRRTSTSRPTSVLVPDESED